MNQRLSSLDEIEAAIWLELARAVDDREHEWRTPVFASVADDDNGGVSADARTVILRGVDESTRRLMFYSDARAQKVAQLAARPQATLVAWSRSLEWQLRCRLDCQVEETGLAVASRWARIKTTRAAQDYLSPLAPGTLVGSQPPVVERREHFALLSARILSIDWLELDAGGHRRAFFEAGKPAVWLQP